MGREEGENGRKSGEGENGRKKLLPPPPGPGGGGWEKESLSLREDGGERESKVRGVGIVRESFVPTGLVGLPQLHQQRAQSLQISKPIAGGRLWF